VSFRLSLLSELKVKFSTGWDDLVIDAVRAHYGLDKCVMALPRAERPQKTTEESKAK